MKFSKNVFSVSLLKKNFFSRNYHILKSALKTYRLFPKDYMIQRIQSKIPLVSSSRKRSTSSQGSNPISEIDSIIKDGNNQFEKTKDSFHKFKSSNDLFYKNYKLLVKNSSDGNIYENKTKNKEDNLFKSAGVLLNNPNDLYFYFLNCNKTQKIKISNEKSVKYIQKIKDILLDLSSKDKNEKNKAKEKSDKKEENQMNLKLILNKNDNNNNINNNINNKIDEIKKLMKYIIKTNQNLKLLKQNKNSFDGNNGNIMTNLNKTSTTGNFSPIITSKLNCHPSINQKIEKKQSKNIVLINNEDRKDFIKNRRKSILNYANRTSFLKLRKKSTSFGKNMFNIKNLLNPINKVELYYEKTKLNPKLSENEFNKISQLFNKNNQTPLSLKANYTPSQLYNSIKNTKIRLQNLNVKNSVRKIYTNRVPFETNLKINKLEEVENEIKSFEGKLYKCVLDNKYDLKYINNE